MFSLWKLILGVEKAFIHSETWRPGSRQSRNISSVYSLPLLPSSAFPHTLWFCNFPPVPSHPIFCWGYLKSCSSHVPCSRITLKYFQICYYIRKRELKLSKSSLGICSCSANKAICWLLTNWPTVLLTKCSKQFRNSSLKAAWIFWKTILLLPRKKTDSMLKGETSHELGHAQLPSYQPVTWPPLISWQPFLEDGTIIMLHWLSGWVYLHCYCFGTSYF